MTNNLKINPLGLPSLLNNKEAELQTRTLLKV